MNFLKTWFFYAGLWSLIALSFIKATEWYLWFPEAFSQSKLWLYFYGNTAFIWLIFAIIVILVFRGLPRFPRLLKALRGNGSKFNQIKNNGA